MLVFVKNEANYSTLLLCYINEHHFKKYKELKKRMYNK